MRSSLLLAAMSLVLAPPVTAQGIAQREIRPGVLLLSGYANGNVLAAEHQGGLILVDAQSAQRVAELDSVLRTVSPHPVRWVVNTHYHEDHTGGNAHWRAAGAEVVAQANVPVQAGKDTVIVSWGNWHRVPLPTAAMPTRLVQDTLTVGPARLVHLPTAHTDGDLLVVLRAHDVIHLGDVLELGAPPFIDWWAGGTMDGMVAAVDRALKLAGPSTIIVPGHGEPTDREGLQRYRQMLVEVRDAVAAALAAGETPETVVDLEPAAAWEEELGGPRRAAQFVRVVAVGLGAGN